MFRQDPNKTFSFEYDEQGTIEVSEQIMNSYNSGFIDQEIEQFSNQGYQSTEE